MNSCLAVNKAAMSHALAFLRGRGVSRESEPGGTTEKNQKNSDKLKRPYLLNEAFLAKSVS